MNELVGIPKTQLEESESILRTRTEDDVLIFYISDLHIDYRITESDNPNVVIGKIIDRLKNSIKFSDYQNCKIYLNRIVIIAGDVSDNFTYFKKFFRKYINEIGNYVKQTIFVPGNHDVWNRELFGTQNIDKRLDKIKNYFNKYKDRPVVMLNNEIYFSNDCKILNCEDLLANTTCREIFNRNGFAIFGAMGYAGCNSEFNCDNNIYNGTLTSRSEEIARSKIVDRLHDKLAEIAGDKTIVFVTHMPKSDWSSNRSYVEKWFYISGHTHKPHANLTENSTLHIRDDNQIGYNGMNYAFKFFYTSKVFNPFCDIDDGIHEIGREKYILFYNGIGEYIDFNRDFNKLYMIKKNATYMFFMCNRDGKLYALSGGNIRKLNHNLEYYYQNIDTYTNNANAALNDYWQHMYKVEQIIKSIGGTGRIHGCIIDIDFFNHIYINPYDGKATPYYATSVIDKYPERDLTTLLKKHCKELYPKWKKLYIASTHCQELLPNSKENSIRNEPYTDTAIYKISKIMLNFQRIYKYKVVRIWNDEWVKSLSLENGKEIIKYLLDYNSTKSNK